MKKQQNFFEKAKFVEHFCKKWLNNLPCNVCFKKIWTNHSSDTVLQFVQLFWKQTLTCFCVGLFFGHSTLQSDTKIFQFLSPQIFLLPYQVWTCLSVLKYHQGSTITSGTEVHQIFKNLDCPKIGRFPSQKPDF